VTGALTLVLRPIILIFPPKCYFVYVNYPNLHTAKKTQWFLGLVI